MATWVFFMIEKRHTTQDLADEGPKLSLERTRLAKERTFAAWLRTALSSIAVGLAAVKLLPSIEPRWLLRTIGFIFVGAGSLIVIFAFHSYQIKLRQLEQKGYKGLPTIYIDVLTTLFVIGALLGLVLIILD